MPLRPYSGPCSHRLGSTPITAFITPPSDMVYVISLPLGCEQLEGKEYASFFVSSALYVVICRQYILNQCSVN